MVSDIIRIAKLQQIADIIKSDPNVLEVDIHDNADSEVKDTPYVSYLSNIPIRNEDECIGAYFNRLTKSEQTRYAQYGLSWKTYIAVKQVTDHIHFQTNECPTFENEHGIFIES